MDTPIADLRAAALAAAERGWPVFPLRPQAKRPALHHHDACPGTGPCATGHQGWEQRATTDAARIHTAWAQAPYNVGLATGPAGLCVLDLDTAKPGDTADDVPPRWRAEGAECGEDVLILLADEAGQNYPAETLTVATPSGGRHLYFTAPEGVELRNTEGERGRGLGWKVDTRAVGGYVLAPGSITRQGAYTVLHDAPVAPLPEWLTERLTPTPPPPAPVVPIRPTTGPRSRYLDAAMRAEAARVHEAPKSQRNAALYAAALALGQLVAGGALTEEDVYDALLHAAQRHISLGAYSQRQAQSTVASGLRAGANRPRHIA